MRLFRKTEGAVVQHQEYWYEHHSIAWDELIATTNLYTHLEEDLKKNWSMSSVQPVFESIKVVSQQEVWAAGVTYLRSKVARMEEAEEAGGGDFYDKVYEADRPEIFFKATAARTVGNGDIVHIRRDSTWNVPEPELTLLCNSEGGIEGYTIGNDMSSRSIEGENPLYLPQAKTYDACAALGPCIYLMKDKIPLDTQIAIQIIRKGKSVFSGKAPINQMKRKLEDLVAYLFRECSFPQGCFLMTGTCIVPDDDFTLQIKDEIRIQIEGIGELVNFVGERNL